MDRSADSGYVPSLEPLTVGQTLDAGFRLWRKDFGRLVGTIALIHALPAALTFLFMQSEVIDVTRDGLLLVEDPEAYNDTANLLNYLDLAATFFAFTVVLAFFARRYVGESPAMKDSAREALSRILPFIGLAIVYWIMVIAGFFLLVVPGIILAVTFGLAFPAFWAEGASIGNALTRGRMLSTGRRWNLFGLILATALLVVVFYAVIAFVILATFFSGSRMLVIVGNSVTNLAAVSIVAPLIPTMMTVAYYDLRVRKEGFDVELAARYLDEPPPPPPPSPYT